MKSAKWVILYSHIATFYLDFTVSVLIKPFIYFPSVAVYATGILSRLGLSNPFLMWIGQAAYPIQQISLVMLFENRFSKISTNPKFIVGNKTRIVFYTLNYIFLPSLYIPTIYSSSDQIAAKLEILKTIPCPEYHFFWDATYVIPVNSIQQSLTTAFVSIYLFGLASFFAFTSGYCLLRRNSAISQKTRDMQKRFWIALIIQVVVPFVVLFIPFAIYSGSMMTGTVFTFVRSLIIFFITLHGILSGVLLVLLHRPYRQFTVNLLLNWKRGLTKVKPRSTRNVSGAAANS
ncbi:hypothetical protein CAEBREN_32422 [Caenorhabditis brenneri]|uniref:Uncharacterized protein n=1 Tax=Caenorhabditis brenneri TaxID=135651 RepID=G0NEL0_CAEBE|nr:hypothetical protein CAEBREN_32422 [Caenorhabditis brenneri]